VPRAVREPVAVISVPLKLPPVQLIVVREERSTVATTLPPTISGAENVLGGVQTAVPVPPNAKLVLVNRPVLTDAEPLVTICTVPPPEPGPVVTLPVLVISDTTPLEITLGNEMAPVLQNNNSTINQKRGNKPRGPKRTGA
jgi:hypothetical protein